MASEEDLIQQIQSHVDRLVQAVADAEFWHDRWLEQAKEEHQQEVSAAEARYQQAVADAQSKYDRLVQKATEEHEERVHRAETDLRQAKSEAKTERSNVPGCTEGHISFILQYRDGRKDRVQRRLR